MVTTPNNRAITPALVGKNIAFPWAKIIMVRISEGKKNLVALIVNGVAPPEYARPAKVFDKPKHTPAVRASIIPIFFSIFFILIFTINNLLN